MFLGEIGRWQCHWIWRLQELILHRAAVGRAACIGCSANRPLHAAWHTQVMHTWWYDPWRCACDGSGGINAQNDQRWPSRTLIHGIRWDESALIWPCSFLHTIGLLSSQCNSTATRSAGELSLTKRYQSQILALELAHNIVLATTLHLDIVSDIVLKCSCAQRPSTCALFGSSWRMQNRVTDAHLHWPTQMHINANESHSAQILQSKFHSIQAFQLFHFADSWDGWKKLLRCDGEWNVI